MSRVRFVWLSFQREERWGLTACAALCLVCAGMRHARPAASLPPVFVDAPATVNGQHRTGVRSSAGRPVLRIHVAGAVNRPGVANLPVGARVVDAVRTAGGATKQADLQSLNLAGHLQDGSRIVVPIKGQAPQSLVPLTTPPRSAQRDVRARNLPARGINLNEATAEELEALPGVGPAIAQRIVQHREEKGRFQSLQDLDEVKGIGAKKLEQLQPYVIF